jgi:FkbM family methyltransferase
MSELIRPYRRALGRSIRAVKQRIAPTTDSYLGLARGVIHVGANTGQERYAYAGHGLNVIWIEPIPWVIGELLENLKEFEKQTAYECLLTDKDGSTYNFKVANNNGQSSSILDFNLHKDIWPEVVFEKTIELQSTTLDSLISSKRIEMRNYDTLVMDTQGSELLVLKGAAANLKRFKYILTEAADFDAYSGCCRIDDIDSFLKPFGFREIARSLMATRQGGGSYYDILYRRGI